MFLFVALMLAVAARAEPDVRITRGTITVPESRGVQPSGFITLAYVRLHGSASSRLARSFTSPEDRAVPGSPT